MSKGAFLVYTLIILFLLSCMPEYTREEAEEKVYELLDRVSVSMDIVNRGQDFPGLEKEDLAETLPDISKYPLVVDVRQRRGVIAVEIFVSTEKSGMTKPDNWLTIMAERFNEENIQLDDGKTARVKIRSIPSGTGYQYIISGKYIPDAYSPSNHLWIEMIKAQGIQMEPISESLAENTAGIVMKDGIYNTIIAQYGEVNIVHLIDAVVQRTISMGYTNPFASSTGLNFLVTVLASFADGEEEKMLSEEVVSAFEVFQEGVPFVSLTTLQMRESVKNDGSLDAFVMEYQTFVNTGELGFGYRFIPFGLKHNNPLYAVGNINSQEKEVLKSFAEYLKKPESIQLAAEYGFYRIEDYEPLFSLPSGELLIEAQKLWKDKKDAGKPIIAVFLSDVSGSMSQVKNRSVPIERLKDALRRSIRFINEENYIGLVAFSDEVTVLLDIQLFSSLQQSRFLEAVNSMAPGGGTAMYDGIVVALKMLLEAKESVPDGKLLLFILTDGETEDGLSYYDVFPVIKGLKVPVYTIGYNANLEVLKNISSINEAATINGDDENITYILSTLLNAEM